LTSLPVGNRKSHEVKNGVIFEDLPPKLEIFQFGAKKVFQFFSRPISLRNISAEFFLSLIWLKLDLKGAY
jgi:hypothetical protein